MTHHYELRLLNERGGLLLLFVTQILSEIRNPDIAGGYAAVGYSRYELWQDGEKIEDGESLPLVA